MSEYHKIQTVFKRDPATNHRTLLEGQYALPEFEYLASCPWTWTEKVDGTNVRVSFFEGQLSFGGRTDNAQMPVKLLQRLSEVFLPQADLMSGIFGGSTVTLYGEGYGSGIQRGGGNYSPTQQFVLFDVLVGIWWLQRPDVEDVALRLGLDVAPVIGQGTLVEMVEYTRRGFGSMWGDFRAEGIVARPQTELRTRGGERIITKIKTRDFQ